MYKRYICLLLAFCILVAGLPTGTVLAATDDTLYTEMFSTETAAYYMTCQPKSAIVLTPTVTLDKTMLSPNYRGGIVDLPRLQVGYYYTASGKFTLLDTMYPTLAWNDDAVGSSTTLSIRSQDTGKTMKTVSIKVPNDAKLHGMDYWYPEEDTEVVADIASADASWAPDGVWSGRKVTKKKWLDCSDAIVRDLVEWGMKEFKGNFALYDSAMHRDSIVMSQYVYCSREDSYSCLNGITGTRVDINKVAYELSRYTLTEDTTVESNVKDYLGTLSNGAVRPGLLFYGSTTENCTFNPNSGKSVTTIAVGDSDTLYYFIATANKCYFYKMDTFVAGDELDEVDDNAPAMSWESNMHYNLQTGNKPETAGFTTTAVNMDYGPLNFTTCLKKAGENYVLDGKYGITHTFMKPQSNLNLYAESLIYPGCVPHFGKVDIKAAQNQVTINYYIKEPNTSSYKLLFDKPQVYNAAIFKDAKLAEMPEVENYQARCWFIDQGLKTKFDQSSVDPKANKTLSLYGDYMYVGGTYKVRFYDERTKYDKSFVMQADRKPTLPPTLTDKSGYVFSKWIIVNDIADKEGQDYIAEEFIPIANSEYIFKAVWSNKGGISKIETTKKDYVIGEELNLDTIKVTVVDDNGEHVATKEEFTVDKTKLDVAGTITITVTLKSSGVTGTFTVNVSDIVAESITATYKGGSVYVGREIQPSDIEVTVYYNNGSNAKTTEFTISPPTVLVEGTNSIDIFYLDLKSAVTIVGIPYDEEEDDKQLIELDADCTLDYIYLDEEVQSSDMVVIAIYDDGSEVTLSPEQFKISPTSFSTPGVNQINVEYGGMSIPVEVAVRSKSSADTIGVGDSVIKDKDESDNTSTEDRVLGGLYGTGEEIKVPTKKPDKKPSTDDKKPSTPSKPQTPTQKPQGDISHVPGTSTGNSTHNDALQGQDKNPSTQTGGTPNGNVEMGNNGSSGNAGNTGSSNSGGNDETESDSGFSDDSSKRPEIDNNVGDKEASDASVGYLDGATILTNTMGLTGLQTISVNIKSLIDDARKNTDVYVDLPNGNNNNILTSDILGKIKRKNLTVHLNMVKPTDLDTTVATWTIVGRKIDTSSTNLNPNVTFEVTDKSSDRLVYFAIADGTYPLGCTLTITPEANCYNSGELCRLYSCDINKGNAAITSTVVWQDGTNNFVYDVYGHHSYCLSNSPNAYPEGASMLESNGMPSAVEGEPSEVNTSIDDTLTEDFWDDDTTPNKTEKGFPEILKKVMVVAAIVFGVLLVIAVIILLVKKFLLRRRTRTSRAATPPEQESTQPRQPVRNIEDISFDTLERPSEETDDFDGRII